MEKLHNAAEGMVNGILSLVNVSPELLEFCTGSSQVQFIIVMLSVAVVLSIWNLPWSDLALYNLYESIGKHGSKMHLTQAIKDSHILIETPRESSIAQNSVGCPSMHTYPYERYAAKTAQDTLQSNT